MEKIRYILLTCMITISSVAVSYAQSSDAPSRQTAGQISTPKVGQSEIPPAVHSNMVPATGQKSVNKPNPLLHNSESKPEPVVGSKQPAAAGAGQVHYDPQQVSGVQAIQKLSDQK